MPGKERPRAWLPLDVDHFHQDSIIELGERFGPPGPVVFLVILTEAKRHASSGNVPAAKQGTVSLRYRAVAHEAFLRDQVDLVRRVVAACIEVGLLDPIELAEDRFEVRLTKWDSWETRDSGAADRQRRHRQRVAESTEEPDDDQDTRWLDRAIADDDQAREGV